MNVVGKVDDISYERFGRLRLHLYLRMRQVGRQPELAWVSGNSSSEVHAKVVDVMSTRAIRVGVPLLQRGLVRRASLNVNFYLQLNDATSCCSSATDTDSLA